MPERLTYYCDVCGQPKREVNRWWICAISDRVYHPNDHLCPGFFSFLFSAELWDELREGAAPFARAAALACGEEHATELYSRFLSGGDFTAPSQRPVSSHHHEGDSND